MALLDFLKNKNDAEEIKKTAKKQTKVSAVKTEKAKGTKKIEKNEAAVKVVAPKSNGPAITSNFSYEAIKQPHISEKASYLAEVNQYIFEVSPSYNKTEIKNAVEGIYGVNVLSVNVIKIPAKKRRLGKTEGFRKAYKKAIVKIKNGQKIEIL